MSKNLQKDGLTGLSTKFSFMKEFEENLKIHTDKNSSFSLSLIDLDHFKLLNDREGHTIGDELLIQLAALIKGSLRKHELVYRYGGDEFAIIFPSTNREQASYIMSSLEKSIETTEFILEAKEKNVKIKTSIKFGISCFPEDGNTGTELLKKADMALWKAKKNRKF